MRRATKRGTGVGVALAASLVASAGHACFLEAGLGGSIATSDPLTIPVLVAGREAAAAERIGWFAASDEEALRDAVLFLSFLPRVAAGATVPAAAQGASFAVLQVQSGYWTRYHVGADGALAAEGHAAGPAPGEAVIAVSDSALIAILRGRLDVKAARDMGLIRGRGDAVDDSMRTFEDILAAFQVSSFGQRVQAAPIPSIDRLSRPAER